MTTRDKDDVGVSRDSGETGAELYVVGVGASAGGLEALEVFFQSLPVDTGMAFVVVQHLSPDFKSHMEELLGRRTQMPVVRVENGMHVEPNSIYLIPPKMEMVISQRNLLLTEKSPMRELSHPIDQFFRSLAGDLGDHSIGIILSGTGSDGSRGIKAIHEAGGLVLSQNPESSKFDGMPLNAQATGLVDIVSTPEGLAESLVRFSKGGMTPKSFATEVSGIASLTELEKVFELLRGMHGIDFAYYKAGTVGRRIERRMNLLQVASLGKYVDYLKSHSDELNQLYKDLLIGVTRFFRDRDAFARLQSDVIPAIIDNCSQGKEIRVWSVGCASGEEAYSLAMLFNDCIRRKHRRIDIKIFATDAHPLSLNIAARGIYSDDQLEDVSESQRTMYFRRHPEGWQVSRDLRRMVLFAPHNVISDAPFTQMDLIVCRNMLIYLQQQPQKKVLSMFHFALKTGGSLFLGPSEGPGDIADEFQVVDAKWRIYRKRRDIRLPVDSRPPLVTGKSLMTRMPLHDSQAALTPHNDRTLLRTYDALLSRHMPPSILVADNFDTLHIFGKAERFLRIRQGRTTNNVLDIVSDELKNPLKSALQQAKSSGQISIYELLPAQPGSRNDGEFTTLSVEPIEEPVSRTTTFLIRIQLDEDSAKREAGSGRESVDPQSNEAGTLVYKPSAAGNSSPKQVDLLESELRFTRENLQATIEELEASNEEMQATNEELVASNEELQSTNEELHSVNEELFTVNAEHQRRVEELAEANDDMDNLLETTRVGVIFLDETLCIRRYTPEIGKVFHVVPQDIGRSIRSFTHNLKYDKLVEDLETVLASNEEFDTEVNDGSGKVYLVRITPYRSVLHNRGVVMTLIDITARIESERQLMLRQLAIDSASNGILITDPSQPDCPITYVNRGFTEMTGYTAEEAIGKNCRFLQGPMTDRRTVDSMRTALENGHNCRVTLLNYRKNGSAFWNDLQITAVHNEAGRLINFVGVQHDITDQVEAKERARLAAERIRAILDSTAEGIFGVDLDGVCSFCNRACTEMLGFSGPEELVGKNMHELIHHSWPDRSPMDEQDCAIYNAVRAGSRINVDSECFWRADGSCFPVEYWSYPIERDGEIAGAVVTFVDTSLRRQQQEQLRLANDAANAANRAKSQFLANMSHELRTPMAVVMGFADIILEESADESINERALVIRRNGEYLLKLLNDILDLSRVEVGALRLENAKCDVSDFLDDLQSMMLVRASEEDRPLFFHLPTELPKSITTDVARVRQILVNIIGNAIKFSPDGRVDVSVGMTMLGNFNAIQFRVSDTGIGMSDEEQASLFQPFTQANNNVVKSFGGTGLGLSISKRLIDSMGGTLELESREGEGSTFTITLPVDPIGPVSVLEAEGVVENEARDEVCDDVLRNARVLLADDMRDVRYVARHFLQKAGCRVTIVENGKQAVDAVQLAIEQNRPYDFMILDMQMPEMTGLEAIEEIRRRGIRIPAIALTADAMKGTRRRVLRAGFDVYLSKPITAKLLLAASAKVIGTRA